MSSKRWDKEEKKRLIGLFSSGKSYGDIGVILDRSESAIRLRLQSIVYDGLVDRGLKVEDIRSMLNTDAGTVVQLFYAHRQFKEGRGEEVIPSDKADKLIMGSASKRKAVKSGKKVDDLVPDDDDSTRTFRSTSIKQAGLAKAEQENRVMEAIIKNREYRKQIKKLYKDGKLTETEKKSLEQVLSE